MLLTFVSVNDILCQCILGVWRGPWKYIQSPGWVTWQENDRAQTVLFAQYCFAISSEKMLVGVKLLLLQMKSLKVYLREVEECEYLRMPGWLNRLSFWLLISAQVMISWFVECQRPKSRSALTAWSLPGSSLPLCPYPVCFLALKINKLFKEKSVSILKGKEKNVKYLNS